MGKTHHRTQSEHAAYISESTNVCKILLLLEKLSIPLQEAKKSAQS